MIINTGMRTDIPAFYSTWLLNRIKEGYVLVRNPYYRNQVTRYNLSPELVDCLAFCTKNPHPLISHLNELDKFKQFWFVTITPYGKDLEPNVPDKKQVIEDFKILFKHLGANAVALRYDPILLNDKFTIEKHIYAFDKLLSQLQGYTKDVTISFLDMYDKVKRNAPNIRTLTDEEQNVIGREFAKIGKKYGMVIHACCEKEDLAEYGIDISGCMSQEIVEKAIGYSLNAPKNGSKRESCNCLMGNDIGMYNTCMHLCKYCYANYSEELVKNNVLKHNPVSPFLVGESEEGDKVTNAQQLLWKRKNKNMEQIKFKLADND